MLIEQVLINILDNAAKFSPSQSTINLEVRSIEQIIQIAISDEGIGIPHKDREAVFKMFYTGQGSDRSVYGSGLGLAICHGMVKAHGGTIEIADNTHKGTTVIIRLPLKTRNNY